MQVAVLGTILTRASPAQSDEQSKWKQFCYCAAGTIVTGFFIVGAFLLTTTLFKAIGKLCLDLQDFPAVIIIIIIIIMHSNWSLS